MKKSSRKGLVRKLDTVFSEYIRLRDRICVICGKRENLSCGHLITRSKYAVRWDERNAHCQCSGCNYSHEYNPHTFTTWFIKKFGLRAYTTLVRDSNKTTKFSDRELELLAERFQKKINQLKQ